MNEQYKLNLLAALINGRAVLSISPTYEWAKTTAKNFLQYLADNNIAYHFDFRKNHLQLLEHSGSCTFRGLDETNLKSYRPHLIVYDDLESH